MLPLLAVVAVLAIVLLNPYFKSVVDCIWLPACSFQAPRALAYSMPRLFEGPAYSVELRLSPMLPSPCSPIEVVRMLITCSSISSANPRDWVLCTRLNKVWFIEGRPLMCFVVWAFCVPTGWSVATNNYEPWAPPPNEIRCSSSATSFLVSDMPEAIRSIILLLEASV